ncbi:MAG: TetR/AcrR family transcriptional regulator [Eubacterium sp.]|nr:TetR/AcrR family transcriptional regulator [Eubacterium sp.]
MDKRKQKNQEVKQAITEAFFRLMRRREDTEISVTDLVREAKVARVSYYRNFDSKEDIVASLVDTVLEEYEDGVNKEIGFYCYQHILRSFQFFEAYQEYMLDIIRFNYTRILLEKLNRFHERMDGDVPANSLQRYRIYAYMGALVNTVLFWIGSGKKETPTEMALQFCSMMGITAGVPEG